MPLQSFISLNQNVSLILFLSEQFCAHTEVYVHTLLHKLLLKIIVVDLLF